MSQNLFYPVAAEFRLRLPTPPQAGLEVKAFKTHFGDKRHSPRKGEWYLREDPDGRLLAVQADEDVEALHILVDLVYTKQQEVLFLALRR